MKKFIPFSLLIACCLLPVINFSQNHNWHTVNGWTQGNATLFKIIDSNLYVFGMCAPQDTPQCTASNRQYLWRFNGTKWDSIGRGIWQGMGDVALFNNELYITCGGVLSGLPWPNYFVPNTTGLAKYNGIQWMAVDSPMNASTTALQYKNDLYIGGDGFPNCSGCKEIARYNGTTWNNMQGGLSNALGVGCFAIYNGDLIVGGNFGKAGNLNCSNIARWNGTQWDSLGSGIGDAFAEVKSLVVDTAQNLLYATGTFISAGGIPVPGVAAWDGTKWMALGNPPAAFQQYGVYASELFEGNLYCCSADLAPPLDTLLWRWNGSSWQCVLGPDSNYIHSLRVYDGNLYVGGSYNYIYSTNVRGLACYGDSCPGTPIPVSINELNHKLKFNIYPNPAKNNITIETEENKNFITRITNPLGQKVSEKKFQKRIEIDVSSYGKGLFLVEVCDEKGNRCHTEKVLIR